ncbi:acyl-CoA N-acyltransferase [Cutaneotrichosporon oleaginosum]|uniref:Acyl-CoA N-acyltransferase n=1 Tax=Cutaneotrichosporon oleaginosum TaxID=879819 RepID=A0A0J0XMP2_9TREE|nr:acyl-CoA N-acyltransferase [Cutaneotrichosporon oleaginosum]KLT42362.1 acyl-CoA N-acyltransferase [Cutaneotrichosporon oleaginosum]TXT04182.1 hypothetical protein COLE_07879 [Cutaneotrichosporon oleaginosum]
MAPTIRPATDADMAHLQHIEDAADTLFLAAFRPETWHTAEDARTRMAAGGWVLVAGEAGEAGVSTAAGAVVGFVHVLDHLGTRTRTAHIEALAVHPAHGRRGVGRALVCAAIAEARRRGYRRITLRTYADVPWNAPFYASCGFEEVTEPGAFYAACEERERAAGLMRYGRRITMARDVEVED